MALLQYHDDAGVVKFLKCSHTGGPGLFSDDFLDLYHVMFDVKCNRTPWYTKKLRNQNIAIYGNILLRQFSVRTFLYTTNTNINRYN